MATDIKGDLYVADLGNSRVQIYAAGLNGKPTTLNGPGQFPTDVDSFANGAYVAVVNLVTTSYGPGSVTIYTQGVAGAPITDPSVNQMNFAAFDGHGNLYVDGSTHTAGFIGEIAGATNGGTKLTMLTTANRIAAPGGIQVTNSGRIAILDQGSNVIYTYNPPVGGSLGVPVAVTKLGGQYASIPFVFTKDMKHVYTTNYNDDNLVLEYAYPAGGKAVSYFYSEGSFPYAVAVIPTQLPGGN